MIKPERRVVEIDLDRLKELAAKHWTLRQLAFEFGTSAYTVRNRMIEAGIDRGEPGRPKGAVPAVKRKVRGPLEDPPEGLVIIGRTHQPCGVCQALVPIRGGCGHWRTVAVDSDAKAERRREADRIKQRRHRAEVKARVEEFQRQQGLR